MPKQQAKGVLQIASEQVPSGIYAVEKVGQGYIELVNMPMTKREIKKKRKEYGRQGFKVYANE